MKDEAQPLIETIAELKHRLAAAEAKADDEVSRQLRFAVAHGQALEAALISLAIEVREELGRPDLIERVAARLSHADSPRLRQQKDSASRENADAVDRLAGRLEGVPKPPHFEE